MANMFATLAKRATTLSSIMQDREKITTDELISKYPNGVTVTEFDVVTTPDKNGNPSTYPVIAFAEDDTKFFYGGKAMMDIITTWLAHFEGDIDGVSNALKAGGGCKVKLYASKTNKGHNFTKVDVIG